MSSSAEVVLTSLLLEEVELLKGLQSVHSEDEFTIGGHSQSLHGVLELDIVEDRGSDVVGVLLSEGLIWARLNLGEEGAAVVLDGGSDLGAELSGVVVPSGLGEADSEREI